MFGEATVDPLDYIVGVIWSEDFFVLRLVVAYVKQIFFHSLVGPSFSFFCHHGLLCKSDGFTPNGGAEY